MPFEIFLISWNVFAGNMSLSPDSNASSLFCWSLTTPAPVRRGRDSAPVAKPRLSRFASLHSLSTPARPRRCINAHRLRLSNPFFFFPNKINLPQGRFILLAERVGRTGNGVFINYQNYLVKNYSSLSQSITFPIDSRLLLTSSGEGLP